MKKYIPFIIMILVTCALITVILITGNSGEEVVITDNDEDEPVVLSVCIKGEIMFPGIYEVEKGSILNELIIEAGGLTDKAGKDINLVYSIDENITIYIKAEDEGGGMDVISDIGSSEDVILQTEDEIMLFEDKININTATLEGLCMLPGIGEVTAKRIIEYRQTNGPYLSIEAIMDVPGIKTSKFEKIRDYITVDEQN
jgi:competence protein ComEA